MDLQNSFDNQKQPLMAPGINDSVDYIDSSLRSTQENSQTKTGFALNASLDDSQDLDIVVRKPAAGSIDSNSSKLGAYTGTGDDADVSFDVSASSKNSLLKRQ